MKVLISADRIGLAIAKSFAENKIDFVCIGYKGFMNLAFYSSKVKNKRLFDKHPLTHPKLFIKNLIKVIKKDKIDLIFPLSPHEDYVILNHLDEITKFSELAYDHNARKIALDKEKTLALGRRLGIPVPKTLLLSEFLDSKVDMKYPLVVKPKIPYKYPWIHAKVIATKKDMQSFLRRYRTEIDKVSFLVQEYIPGSGCGFFALFNKKKKLIAYFMHRRVHETLGWGGMSALAKSYHNKQLRAYGERLLRNMGFGGIAMAEFRSNCQSGDFVLMEVNGRYWGSLPLALATGVNFPILHVKYWEGDIPTPITSSNDIYGQWLLGGELSWLGSAIKNQKLNLPAYSPPSFFTAVKDIAFYSIKSRKTHFILDRKDIGPAVFWMKYFLSNIYPKIGLNPPRFSWIIRLKLAASARPRSKLQIRWLKLRGIKAILTLTESPLPIEWLNGIDYFHVPMKDHQAPSVKQLFYACKFIEEKIKQGRSILVHCLGGYGRTGTVLACFLVGYMKIKPEAAINFIRRINHSFIEEKQEESVYKYYELISNPNPSKKSSLYLDESEIIEA